MTATPRAGRGPGKYASREAVLNRLRRLPNETAFQREAKRLAREEGRTMDALEMLVLGGDADERHVAAHQAWLDLHGPTQPPADAEPEDLA